jgi:hypothetical protein
MAVLKYSVLVSEVKGSVGGATFQRCGQSLSVRSNPSHRRAGTLPANESRLQFSTIANAWRGLSKAQQDQFGVVSPSYPFTDRFGTAFVANGYQLFVSLNRMLVMVGDSFITVPQFYSPPVFTRPHINPYVLDGSVMNFDFSAALPADSWFIVFLSNPLRSPLPFNSIPYYYGFSLDSIDSGVNDFGVQVSDSLKLVPNVGEIITLKSYIVSKLTGNYLLLNQDQYPVV